MKYAVIPYEQLTDVLLPDQQLEIREDGKVFLIQGSPSQRDFENDVVELPRPLLARHILDLLQAELRSLK
jgi:hypothetical protein